MGACGDANTRFPDTVQIESCEVDAEMAVGGPEMEFVEDSDDFIELPESN